MPCAQEIVGEASYSAVGSYAGDAELYGYQAEVQLPSEMSVHGCCSVRGAVG